MESEPQVKQWKGNPSGLLSFLYWKWGEESECPNLWKSGDVTEGLPLAYMKEIRSIFPIMIGEVFNINSLYQNMSDCLQVSGILIKDSSLFYCYYHY